MLTKIRFLLQETSCNGSFNLYKKSNDKKIHLFIDCIGGGLITFVKSNFKINWIID